jgi:hypothetical protein
MTCKTLTALQIERYETGICSNEERERIGAHCRECAECDQQFRDLDEHRYEYLFRQPFSSFESKLPKFHESRRKTAVYGIIYAASVLIAALFVYSPHLFPDGKSQEGIRLKSPDELQFVFESGDERGAGDTSRIYSDGDVLQFLYTNPEYPYLALISVDSQGLPTFFNSSDSTDESASIPIDSGVAIPYPYSIVLDDTEGSELFVAVFSKKNLTRSQVQAWLQTQAFSDGSLHKLRSGIMKHPLNGSSVKSFLLKRGRK